MGLSLLGARRAAEEDILEPKQSFYHVMLCLLLFVPIPLLPLLLLLGLPALLAVVCDMWAWPVMEQAFHISEQQAARRAEREAQQ